MIGSWCPTLGSESMRGNRFLVAILEILVQSSDEMFCLSLIKAVGKVIFSLEFPGTRENGDTPFLPHAKSATNFPS